MVAQWGEIITDGEFLLHTMYSEFSKKLLIDIVII